MKEKLPDFAHLPRESPTTLVMAESSAAVLSQIGISAGAQSKHLQILVHQDLAACQTASLLRLPQVRR